jgi:hypothetical protein
VRAGQRPHVRAMVFMILLFAATIIPALVGIVYAFRKRL